MKPDNLFDVQAEHALVGCCILWPVFVISKIIGRVGGDEFFQTKVGALFSAIVRLHEAGRPVDDLTVLLADLKTQNLDPEVISAKFILGATKGIPSASNAVYYADRIRSLHRLRVLFDIAKPLQEHVTSDSADPDEILRWLESQTAKTRNSGSTEAKPIASVWSAYADHLQAELDRPKKRALLSGFHSADKLGFVFVPGELTILAARPSVGKTAMASQIGMHHAKHGRNVMFASLEMGGMELGARMILAAAGKNHQLIRTGEYDHQDVEEIRREARTIGDRPFYVYSPGRVRAGVIHAAASVFHASRKLELLIVDYIGLVLSDNPGKPRPEQVGDICKALRDIAIRMEIPVIALCQLNRQADGERPMLSNLRESGDLEQDADQVAFLHPESATKVSLIVAKNRQGGRGTIELEWHAEATRFSDVPSNGFEWTGE